LELTALGHLAVVRVVEAAAAQLMAVQAILRQQHPHKVIMVVQV
jgi:hypothetical protein